MTDRLASPSPISPPASNPPPIRSATATHRTEPRPTGSGCPARNNRHEFRPRAVEPRDDGFSLVELVIVVVIIGIIAAIAVPRISSGAAGAGEAALRASLKSIRDAIDRYAAEHGGVHPGALADGLGNAAESPQAFINQLTLYSDASGNVSTTPASTHPFGPYLRRIPPIPVGPNKGKDGVAVDATHSPPLVQVNSDAWVYNPVTGEIIANSDSPTHDGSRTFDEF